MGLDCAHATDVGDGCLACVGGASCPASEDVLAAEALRLQEAARKIDIAELRAAAEVDALRLERAELVRMCELLFGLVVGSSGFQVLQRPTLVVAAAPSAAGASVEAAQRRLQEARVAEEATQDYIAWLREDVEILRREIEDRPIRRLNLCVGEAHALRVRPRQDDELFQWVVAVADESIVCEDASRQRDGRDSIVREIRARSVGMTAVTLSRKCRSDTSSSASLGHGACDGQLCFARSWLPPDDSLVVQVFEAAPTMTPTWCPGVDMLKSMGSFDGCDSMGATTTDRLREVLLRGGSSEPLGFAMTPNWSASSFSLPSPSADRATPSAPLALCTPLCATPLGQSCDSATLAALCAASGDSEPLADDVGNTDDAGGTGDSPAATEGSLALVAAQFRQHDESGHGTIQRTDLVKLLKALNGSEWTDARVERLLELAAPPQNGRAMPRAIVYEEFLDWLFGDTQGRSAGSTG